MLIESDKSKQARRWGAARLLLLGCYILMGALLLCLGGRSLGTLPRAVRTVSPQAVESRAQTPAPAANRLDLNTADQDALETLPGIGPVLARDILAHREAQGGFAFIEELMDVSGIGEKRFAALREWVTCMPAPK